MNPFNIFNIRQADDQLVVVLQNEHACWFRFCAQELVGSWRESLSAESLSQRTRCPWVLSEEDGTACRVRLVFDTTLDEVDRVKTEGSTRGWMNTVHRMRMARQLHADYPLASVHRLPDYASPDVLSIVHHIIPPEWETWLQQLQSQNVCITHAVTSLELLCERTRHWPLPWGSQASSVESQGGPVLFDVPVGNERRHLLVDNGVPLFMRMVNAPSKPMESGNDALQESMQHVCEQITHSKLTPPVLAPVPPWPEMEPHLQVASVFATLCVDSAVDLQRLPAVCGNESTMANEHGIQVPEKSEIVRLCNKALSATGQLLRCQDKQQRWSLTEGVRFSGDFLQPSIITNRLHQRIRQLQKATLVCAWMATGSVVIASTHGIISAREKARLAHEQQQLSQQIDQLSESVLLLNDEPEFVVRSLARIEAHESVKPAEASGVLALVASIINNFPAIELDSLSWSVMTDNQPVDTAFGVISQVPQRKQLWQADSAAAGLQVDISGTVTDQLNQGLRKQQKVLQSFVEHLQAVPEVAEVNVLEAPVNAARSSDRINHEGSGYHLSLQLGIL